MSKPSKYRQSLVDALKSGRLYSPPRIYLTGDLDGRRIRQETEEWLTAERHMVMARCERGHRRWKGIHPSRVAEHIMRGWTLGDTAKRTMRALGYDENGDR